MQVLCLILQLARVKTRPASNDHFHYQNIVYVCKGFHSSGSCSLDYVSSVELLHRLISLNKFCGMEGISYLVSMGLL